ncbi:hypothetical protein HID58_048996 [Brassica napus]|uniref:Uncharacterized protein n=1 Tax=Brassica napus TaxID=3708 RepID=A0ABQ8B421_BRANA|nr:hypothetical protein HID58_048996 [Brassica napus]
MKLILKSYNTKRDICSKESISTSDQKISQSYAINLPHQLILFVNTQSYRLFLKYLSVTFPLHSTASKILSSPIDLPTIKINNCTIQHNTLFNFFPFPNLAIYTVIFKTKVPHNVILKSTSVFLGNNSVCPRLLGKKICYDHYPQRFDGIGRHDRYSNGSVVFYDIWIRWEPDLVGSLTPNAENSIGVMIEVYWQQDGSG